MALCLAGGWKFGPAYGEGEIHGGGFFGVPGVLVIRILKVNL